MREVNNTGKNQKEPTLKEMCTRLCGTLFLGLEHKLQGESGTYRQWAKIAADLEVGAHPHAAAQKIISAIEETQEKYGTESARILYNTQAVPYPNEIVNAGRYLSAGGPAEYLEELCESGYFMRDLQKTSEAEIQNMIEHLKNGGSARSFSGQEFMCL